MGQPYRIKVKTCDLIVTVAHICCMSVSITYHITRQVATTTRCITMESTVSYMTYIKRVHTHQQCINCSIHRQDSTLVYPAQPSISQHSPAYLSATWHNSAQLSTSVETFYLWMQPVETFRHTECNQCRMLHNHSVGAHQPMHDHTYNSQL